MTITTTMRRRTIVIAAAALLLIGGGCRGNGTAPDWAPEAAKEALDAQKQEGDAATLIIPDQAPGVSVTVAAADMPVDGFVVLKRGGGPRSPTIIGASSLLLKGKNGTVVVLLNEGETVDGEVLYAAVHVDEGSGAFESHLDPLLMDDDGEPVHTTVTISSDAPEGWEIGF